MSEYDLQTDIEQLLYDANHHDNEKCSSAHKPITPTLLGELVDCDMKYVLLRNGANSRCSDAKRQGIRIHRYVEKKLKKRVAK